MALLINDKTPWTQYTIGVSSETGPITVDWEFFADADLVVYKDTTLLTLTTDYSVTGAGVTGGGSITLAAAVASVTITIFSDIAVKRVTDFALSGPFPIDSLNTELDKFTAISLILERIITGAIRLPDTEARVDMTLPVLADRKDKISGFDSNGLPNVSNVVSVTQVDNFAFAAFPIVYAVEDIASSFNGVLTAFALTIDSNPLVDTVGSSAVVYSVFIAGLFKDSSTYSISGSTLTFTSAPTNGQSFGMFVMGVTDQLSSSSGLPVDDTTSLVEDPSDGTKEMRIDVGAVATGTVRILTMPDQNIDLTPDTGTFAAAGGGGGSGSSLPLAGGEMTGNITMAGTETVDGRDLSIDGIKLDTIEADADATNFTNIKAALAAASSSVAFGGQKLSSVSTPAISTDVATKGYVDTATGTGGSIGVANVVTDHSAVADGTLGGSNTNNTAAFQAAVNTGKHVFIPAGDYELVGKIVVSTSGQKIFGEGDGRTRLMPHSGSHGSSPHTSIGVADEGVFTVTVGVREPGPEFHDFQILFHQPTTLSSGRASLYTQADAFNIVKVPRCEFHNLRIIKGMNGIIFKPDAAGVSETLGNSGGSFLNNIKMSCFKENISFDGCQDSMRLNNIHIWPFELNAVQTAVFRDLDSVSYSLNIGWVDDLKVEGLLTYGPRTHLHRGVGSSHYGQSASFTNCYFDSFGGFSMEKGSAIMAACSFTCGFTAAHYMIEMTAATLEQLTVMCTGCWFNEALPNSKPDSAMVWVQNGQFIVTGSRFTTIAGTPNRFIFSKQSGTPKAQSITAIGNSFSTASSLGIGIVVDTVDPSVAIGNLFEGVVEPIDSVSNITTNKIHSNHGDSTATKFTDRFLLKSSETITGVTENQRIQSTSDGILPGPSLILSRLSPNPVDGDDLGEVRFYGKNASAAEFAASTIRAKVLSRGNGSEDAALIMSVVDGGSFRDVITVGPGVQIGSPTGGDKGAGTLNIDGAIYVDGVAVGSGTGDLLAANNLSDVVNATTSFTNIKQTGVIGTTGALALISDADVITGSNTTKAITAANLTARLASPGYIGGTLASGATFSAVQATQPHLTNVGIAANCANTSFAGTVLHLKAYPDSTNTFNLILAYSNNGSDLEFKVTGDGAVASDIAHSTPADYAEFFEWKDGNPKDQDRVGISVVMDDGKIRQAKQNEVPFGIVSALPAFVGNGAALRWDKKYLKDEFGRFLKTKAGNRKLNPDYDPDLEYIDRESRKEWGCIGLIGQLKLKNNQETDSRWIKMRDLPGNLEEWLIR
jgi:hypothetical protein